MVTLGLLKKVPVPGKKRIRKDESYEKNYLIGKYGAIPTLKSIDTVSYTHLDVYKRQV